MQILHVIWGLIGMLVIPGIVYVVLIGKFIQILRNRRRGKVVESPQEDHCHSEVSPIFRIVGAYIGALWMTAIFGVSAFIMAIHRLHTLEKSDYFGDFILLIFPYSCILVSMIQKLTSRLASKRHERLFHTKLPIKIYMLGILSSIIIFFLFQEQNPWAKYGVEFEWYDPADEPGQYHLVHLIRHLQDQTISGPLCGGQYPRITFIDVNQDHREEVVISTKHGQELGVIEVIEPYVPEQPAFKIVRGTCYFPDKFDLPADYLKVTF